MIALKSYPKMFNFWIASKTCSLNFCLSSKSLFSTSALFIWSSSLSFKSACLSADDNLSSSNFLLISSIRLSIVPISPKNNFSSSLNLSLKLCIALWINAPTSKLKISFNSENGKLGKPNKSQISSNKSISFWKAATCQFWIYFFTSVFKYLNAILAFASGSNTPNSPSNCLNSSGTKLKNLSTNLSLKSSKFKISPLSFAICSSIFAFSSADRLGSVSFSFNFAISSYFWLIWSKNCLPDIWSISSCWYEGEVTNFNISTCNPIIGIVNDIGTNLLTISEILIGINIWNSWRSSVNASRASFWKSLVLPSDFHQGESADASVSIKSSICFMTSLISFLNVPIKTLSTYVSAIDICSSILALSSADRLGSLSFSLSLIISSLFSAFISSSFASNLPGRDAISLNAFIKSALVGNENISPSGQGKDEGILSSRGTTIRI